jgi:soluble lytic murein transglycosylase-like protein
LKGILVKKIIAMLVVAFSLVAMPSIADAHPVRKGSCPQYEPLLAAYNMPVSFFSRIMYRESNCKPHVRSRTRDTGLLQINDVNHKYLSKKLGVRVTIEWLKVPENNVRAAHVLYQWGGTRPWKSTR